MPLLLIAFIVVPIVEISVIDRVQDALGWPLTLTLLFLDSVIGAVLVRREGRRAWTKFRETIGSGKWPGDEVTQGGLVLVGGALLVTPGFVTDIVGLAMVVPPTRAMLSKVIRSRMKPPTVVVGGNVFGGGTPGGGSTGRPQGRVGGPGAGPGQDTQGTPGTGRSAGSGDDRVVDVEVVSIEREDGGSGGATDEPKD